MKRRIDLIEIMESTDTHNKIRPAAVAGYFYPDDPDEIKTMISEYMDQARHTDIRSKAIIAPHAGYIYSGPIAANAYSTIEPLKDHIKRVILLGPAHRVYVNGMALSTADYFASPLGIVPIDKTLQEEALTFNNVVEFDQAHAKEHSLEVHLPFLQVLLNDFSLLPVLVGDADANEVANLLDHLWQDEETLIIVSSDLSHFHDYNTAKQIDQATTQAIETFEIDRIGPKQACGSFPVNGLLNLAESRSLKVQTLDVRNSGDTAGSKDQVVGYGSYAIR